MRPPARGVTGVQHLLSAALLVVAAGIGAASGHAGTAPGMAAAAVRTGNATANGAGTPATARSGGVGVEGTSLTLDGQPHFFVGVDAFQAATQYGTNAGCGEDMTDDELARMFESLPPDSLVRIAANQGGFATNVHTGRLDWSPLDRVMRLAGAYHQYIILSLADQGGTCDGSVWQGPAWYSGGFRSVQNPTGRTPLSYRDYMTQAVLHFRSFPSLAMWEPVSEPAASDCPGGDVEGSCTGGQTCPNEHVAAWSLRTFFDAVGSRIHALDPSHPVEAGLLGGGQCGTGGPDFAFVSASPGIDVLSYHDYYPPAVTIGGDQWNGEALRLQQAARLDKPVLAGEMGIFAASDSPDCPDDATRAHDFLAKISAQRALGLAGALLWNYDDIPPSPTTCTLDIGAGDPVLGDLRGVVTNAAGRPIHVLRKVGWRHG